MVHWCKIYNKLTEMDLIPVFCVRWGSTEIKTNHPSQQCGPMTADSFETLAAVFELIHSTKKGFLMNYLCKNNAYYNINTNKIIHFILTPELSSRALKSIQFGISQPSF